LLGTCKIAGSNLLVGVPEISAIFADFFPIHYTANLQILLNGAGSGILVKFAIFANSTKVSIKLKTLGSIYSLQCLQISDTAILQCIKKCNTFSDGCHMFLNESAIFAGSEFLINRVDLKV